MAFAILAPIIHGKFTIDNFDGVSVSNPNFLKQLESISKFLSGF